MPTSVRCRSTNFFHRLLLSNRTFQDPRKPRKPNVRLTEKFDRIWNIRQVKFLPENHSFRPDGTQCNRYSVNPFVSECISLNQTLSWTEWEIFISIFKFPLTTQRSTVSFHDASMKTVQIQAWLCRNNLISWFHSIQPAINQHCTPSTSPEIKLFVHSLPYTRHTHGNGSDGSLLWLFKMASLFST